MTTNLQSLFVVRGDRPDLYDHLRQRFGDAVILDRRQGDRRRSGAAVVLELRRGDRRQSLTSAERDQWSDAGYCVVFLPSGAPPRPLAPLHTPH